MRKNIAIALLSITCLSTFVYARIKANETQAHLMILAEQMASRQEQEKKIRVLMSQVEKSRAEATMAQKEAQTILKLTENLKVKLDICQQK